MSGVEAHLRERLKEVEQVVAVQGRGFLLGLEFADKAAPTHKALWSRKIITGTSSDPGVLRLLPPLCLKTRRGRFVGRCTSGNHFVDDRLAPTGEKFRTANFLTTRTTSIGPQLDQLIESLARRFKQGCRNRSKPLDGKSIALVFFNPSLRTRASMQVGI